MPDDLVYRALRKAIESDTKFRLVSLGEAPEEAGLFPAGTGPSKKAIQACTEGEKPLLRLRDEPGRGKKLVQFAQITDKGITTLVALTPLKEFSGLIGNSAPLLRTRLIRSCLRALGGKRAGELGPWDHRRLVQSCLEATRTHFSTIEARLQEVLNEERLLADSVNDFLKATRTRIEKQKQRLTESLESLVSAVGDLISPSEIIAEGQPRRPQLPEWQRVPTTDPEIDFQKNLSEELVFAWQDASSREIQASLERALFNVGVEPIGQPGDIVAFDGLSQHTEDDIAVGDHVEVIMPGWQLVNPRGTSLIARAKVIKTARFPAHEVVASNPNAGSEPEPANGSQSEPRMEEEPEKPQDEQPVPSPETSPDVAEGPAPD